MSAMPTALRRVLLALWLVNTFVGCASDDAAPLDMGAGSAGSGTGVPALSATAATFTEIYTMFFPRTTNAHCDMCHGLPPYDLSNGNFTTGFDKQSTYDATVGKTSTSSLCMGRSFVVPGKPEESLLLQKLLPDPPCGIRMPNGGMALSDTQIEMFRSWIADGAKDN